MLAVPTALLLASFIAPRLDAHGTPLPPGAIARYGEASRGGGRIDVVSFSPDVKAGMIPSNSR